MIRSIAFFCIVVMLVSCGFSSRDTTDTYIKEAYAGVGEQIQLNSGFSQPKVEIDNITLTYDVTFCNKTGIALNFDCITYGFKGMPLYFYAYVMFENDYDFVKNKDGVKTCGFDVATIMYDAVKFDNGITLYIPYSDLPVQYHGELCIDIVVDGFDDIIETKKNNRFFYSTL